MIRVTRQPDTRNPVPVLVDKRDDSDEFKYVVAQTVGTFLGLLAIGFAVAALLSERVRRVRADDERRFTSDPSVLGCFHSRPVSWPRSRWPRSSWLGSLWGGRTEVLRLPSITGLVEIGDSGAWTSSTLDLMTEKHSEQTWVNLYESVATSVVTSAKLHAKPGKEVWEDEAWENEEPVPTFLKRIGEAQHQENHIPSMWHDRQSAYKADKLSSLYREPSPPQSNESKRGLVRLTSTWIVQDKACIGVTREELAALALIMGVAFSRLGNSLYLSGVGAFGLSLDISHAGTNWFISLAQGSRIPRHVASMGSGYTTLMAKHLACGSVPFAQSEFWVRSVYVRDDVYRAITSGDNIIDIRAFGGDSLEFLRRLPAEKPTDAYYGTRSHSGMENKVGVIFHADGKTEAGKWPRAVTRIAFGGLVPQAHPNVVSAVKFTVAGSINDCIENLERLIDKLQRLALDDDKGLFGENVRNRCQYEEEHTLINYTFPSKDSNPPDAAAIFARYSNLLERVVALVLRQKKENASETSQTLNGAAPGVVAATEALVSKNDVFEAAASEIQKAYEAAVINERLKATSSEDKTEDLGALLGDVISRVEEDPVTKQAVIKLKDCAIIVRCVLAAWAFTVPLIEVKQAAGGYPPSNRAPTRAPSWETKVPQEIILANLPPVSAFR